MWIFPKFKRKRPKFVMTIALWDIANSSRYNGTNDTTCRNVFLKIKKKKIGHVYTHIEKSRWPNDDKITL